MSKRKRKDMREFMARLAAEMADPERDAERSADFGRRFKEAYEALQKKPDPWQMSQTENDNPAPELDHDGPA